MLGRVIKGEGVHFNSYSICYIDIVGSIEFDFSESVRDLFYVIKQLKIDVDDIKNYLHLKK